MAMNAWIYSAGKVVKVAGGAKLSTHGTGVVEILKQNDDPLAALSVGGDTFVVLSEQQPTGGGFGTPIEGSPSVR
jgi:hypothetical protein